MEILPHAMAGIYIHIPFCRKLCYYCDFHFTVSLKHKQRVLRAIADELVLRKQDFKDTAFSTIYLGGGTPSILTPGEINNFLEIIEKNYQIQADPEITIEANPDDLSSNFLSELRQTTPVNRLSIGVQSFNDSYLALMNRRHSADEAYACIESARNRGYENINVDLIYGIPGMTLIDWEEALTKFSKLRIPHLSAYHLSIEPKTVFARYQKIGKIVPIDEEESARQFDYLMSFTARLGYAHYEISNFALPDHFSKHNLGYWSGESYLGVGPSAHSFIPGHRRWNIANNTKYCEEIESGGKEYFTTEVIDRQTGFHDYLLTALRTQWGINTKTIGEEYGESFRKHAEVSARKFIEQDFLEYNNENIRLSRKGKLLADYIIREMMIP